MLPNLARRCVPTWRSLRRLKQWWTLVVMRRRCRSDLRMFGAKTGLLADVGRQWQGGVYGGCGMQSRGLKSSGGSWGIVESYWIASTRSGSSGKGGDGKWVGSVELCRSRMGSPPPLLAMATANCGREGAVPSVRGPGSRGSKWACRSRTMKSSVAGL